ncbi:MAG: ABC transporter substrate-binding protein, partial [Firmicutes bacterium]|nr:ABC transporter substrate-binding protein [Bacillota bacterium]
MFNKKVFISTLSVILLLVLSVGAFAATRTGTWVDEVIILEEPSSATAIKRLQAKDIDIYVEPISETAAFDAVKQDPNLDYYQTFGSYSEITFNTVGPEFNDGRLNPFSNRKIREAMNYLLDRDYIAQEVYGGLAVPKYTIMNSRFADYARVVETARALEIKYGYDKEKAINIIAEEMVAMGAEKVNGKWHYNGSPVV